MRTCFAGDGAHARWLSHLRLRRRPRRRDSRARLAPALRPRPAARRAALPRAGAPARAGAGHPAPQREAVEPAADGGPEDAQAVRLHGVPRRLLVRPTSLSTRLALFLDIPSHPFQNDFFLHFLFLFLTLGPTLSLLVSVALPAIISDYSVSQFAYMVCLNIAPLSVSLSAPASLYQAYLLIASYMSLFLNVLEYEEVLETPDEIWPSTKEWKMWRHWKRGARNR
jgi:hypothetical protein